MTKAQLLRALANVEDNTDIRFIKYWTDSITESVEFFDEVKVVPGAVLLCPAATDEELAAEFGDDDA